MTRKWTQHFLNVRGPQFIASKNVRAFGRRIYDFFKKAPEFTNLSDGDKPQFLKYLWADAIKIAYLYHMNQEESLTSEHQDTKRLKMRLPGYGSTRNKLNIFRKIRSRFAWRKPWHFFSSFLRC